MKTESNFYILWDWNGTLLDDTEAAISTLNRMLAKRGLKGIDRKFYTENFSFPVRPFYEQIGIVCDDSQWDSLAQEYHLIYQSEPKALNIEALSAIEMVHKAGGRQSIISALRQDLLDQDTRRYGVAEKMECVYGTANLDGASKLDRAIELMSSIVASAREVGRILTNVTLIGDSLHDLEVANALGVRCVLCAQGTHSYSRLAAAATTGRTLREAVQLALAAR